MRLGITAKFALVLGMFVLLGTLLVSAVLTRSSVEVLHDVSLRRLDHNAELVSNHLLALLQGVRRDVAFLARTQALYSLARNEPGAEQRVAELFEALALENEWYAQVRIIGVANQGRERVRVDRKQGRVVRIPPRELQPKGHRTYFQETIALASGNIYLSHINLNREHGRISQPLLPTLRVATPVYLTNDFEKPFGIVIINLDMNRVFAEMQQGVVPGGRLYVANKEGDYLLHPDPGRTFGFDLGQHYRIQDDFTGSEHLVSGRSSRLRFQQPRANGDEGMVVAFNRIAITEGTDDGSLLIGIAEPFSQSEADIEPLVESSIRATAGLGTLGVLLCLGLIWLLIRPLRHIANAVSGFPADRYEGDLPLERGDEIGLLARRFHEMTERIQAQLRELTEERGRLDSLVDAAADAIVTINQNGTIEHCNRAVETLFGYHCSELLGQNVKLLMTENDRDKHDEYIQRYLQTGEDSVIGTGREVTGLHKDGSTIPIYVSLGEFEVNGERKFTSIFHNVSDRHQLEQELRALANTDALTGANNRRSFLEVSEKEIKRARRHLHPLGLMLIDVDDFKPINDRYGHAAGDAALKALVKVCERTLRSDDMLGRLGGDEFAVLLPETDLNTALQVAERLSDEISRTVVEGVEGSIYLSLSIGVAALDLRDDMDLNRLMERADSAMYRAKGRGRGLVEAAR